MDGERDRSNNTHVIQYEVLNTINIALVDRFRVFSGVYPMKNSRKALFAWEIFVGLLVL